MTGRHSTALIAAAAAALIVASVGQRSSLRAQGQANAPVDFTGTWVSIVTEDWIERMVTPRKGDFANLPLTQSAQDAAQRADMAAVQRSGRACEAYGAPVVMREPGRVRISWQDASTLRIDTDAGGQTRLLHFIDRAAPPAEPTFQGWSAAEWQYTNGFDPLQTNAAAGRGRGRGRRGGGPPSGRGGEQDGAPGGRLRVTTTNLSPGFLRKNGVPYSAKTTVTEYFNLLEAPDNGSKWFVVTTVVRDPENLVVDYITSTNFRHEPDGSKWRPRPCSID
jgi:hypothetical protein